MFFKLAFVTICFPVLLGTVRSNNNDLLKLKGAFILFRHGDRAPRRTYPNDPHKDYQWSPAGYSFLTEDGIRQMHDCGVKFRKRYQILLPNNQIYNSSLVRVRSSAYPRCLMTAQSFMAGFLPPPDHWVLPINWQPVFIESVPAQFDSTIARKKKCSRYDAIKLNRFNIDNPKIINLLGPNYYLLDYIEEKSGMTFTDFYQISSMADTLFLQERRGLAMPDWAAKLFNDTLVPISLFAHDSAYKSKTSKIQAGTLLKDIVQHLKSIQEGRRNTAKLLVMSGHDVTLNSIIYLLEMQHQISVFIDFGGTFAIELYENQSLKNDYELKVLFFKNYADTNPITLDVPSCASPCTLSKFLNVTQDKVVDDYDSVCNNNYHTNEVVPSQEDIL